MSRIDTRPDTLQLAGDFCAALVLTLAAVAGFAVTLL